ncbi:alpha/beta fold hydrolase [Actinomadura welshii]|uniref:alpha/beta fold hydrolase n=1 Tax=Actinomadura welshii TaxID=3103817 RepID=UPI0003AD4684|nr:alpha/beta fold hydrolase [Actinomadura madurae]
MTRSIGRRTVLASIPATVGLAGVAGLSPAGAEGAAGHAWPVDFTPIPVPDVPLRRGVLELPDARLAWSDTGGDGPVVVLLHARSGSLNSWPYQQQGLRGEGRRVIAYSRRGHEGSTHTAVGYSTDDLIALLDHLAIDQAHLVGHAAGGVPALDAALARPARVRSLSIVCSTMGITDPEFAASVAALRSPEFESMPSEFRELGPSYRSADPAGVREWLKIEERALNGEFFMQGFRSPMDWAAVEATAVPTLLVTTDADNYITPYLAGKVAKRMRRAEQHTIVGCGHCPTWERPLEFNRVISRFVARHR